MASASLLVTTYNWADALERVLLSVAAQRVLPKEVVIADDGSGEDTAQLVKRLQVTFPTKLIHCWQEDKGFRAAAIRNKAIAKMTSDYVVMIDGDMVVNPDFIADHLSAAREGCFIQGSRVITSAPAGHKLLSSSQASYPNFFWCGISNRFNTLRFPLLSAAFSSVNTSLSGTKTCNFSVWRSDLLTVNGFDESYEGWGREDSDLAARLLHAGKRRIKLKLMAVAYHLYHNENSRNCLSSNDVLLARCIAEKRIRSIRGVDQYIRDD